jgi:NitT/TauT family transport system substrate-binding protein
MFKRLHTLLVITLIVTLALAACGGQPTATPTEEPTEEPPPAMPVAIRLSLGYIPDVQFAPWYVGIEKGFFAERGLDVTTEHRQETEGAKLVATGEIRFAVLSGEQVLLARAQEMPLVYVFEWYQRFPVAVAAKTEQGITSIADLAGHSVGVPVREGASYIGLRALLEAGGLTEADIDLQTTGYAQVETLVTGQVDAVVVYAANEPVQLAALGEEIDLIYVADHADLVSNGLVTSEQVIADHPDLVRAMAAAFAESLQYTIDHPDEAFEISKQYVEGLADAENLDVQREVLGRSIELWRAGALGRTEAASWAAMQDLLLEMGLLSESQTLEDAYSNAFLP